MKSRSASGLSVKPCRFFTMPKYLSVKPGGDWIFAAHAGGPNSKLRPALGMAVCFDNFA